MENLQPQSLNEPTSNQGINQDESDTPKKKPVFIFGILLIILLITIGSSFAVYLWQQNNLEIAVEEMRLQKDTEILQLSDKIVLLEQEIDLLKNPPTPDYCEDGDKYQDVNLNYNICLTNNWSYDPNLSRESTIFSKNLGIKDNYIEITSSTDFIENALNKYTSNLYVDDANRDYFVDSVEAIQVSGSIASDENKKRAITVFTKDGITYEISFENREDATYTQNLKEYKEIVESFQFLAN